MDPDCVPLDADFPALANRFLNRRMNLGSSEGSSKAMFSSTKVRWCSGLFLIGVCGFLVIYFLNSLWTTSLDVALHYAVVARISEHWNLPANDELSLEEMNVYPRYSHRLAAIFSNLIGSPLAGMQFLALLSLAALWSGLALIFLSLPRRMLWMTFGALAALLLANRFLVHLELFGNELVGNYFYPQLVAQAPAIMLIASVLWIERAGIPPVVSYLILGCSVPIIQHFHLLPALEILATLTLLVALNLFDARNKGRWAVFALGLFAILASLSLTVLSPAFATVRRISENNGVLQLRYTPNLLTLAIECLIVIALSAFLIRQWMRLDPAEARNNGLALKYLGLFGLAVAGLCLLQILVLKLGSGSEYACKKYAFGLNTLLALDLLLLSMVLIVPLRARLLTSQDDSLGLPAMLFQRTFLGLFVFVAVFTILPSPSAKVIALSDIVSVERFIKEHGHSTGLSAKYDYGIGLFPDRRNFDYLITIGALKAPRLDNADDLLSGYPPSKPRKIGRIFTRVGSKPWDVPDCRQYVSQDGLAILDGQCVLNRLITTGAKTGP